VAAQPDHPGSPGSDRILSSLPEIGNGFLFIPRQRLSNKREVLQCREQLSPAVRQAVEEI
jgi:hypothetical protein